MGTATIKQTDPLAGYGERHTTRALDNLLADIAATPTPTEALTREIHRVQDKLQKELPSGTHLGLQPDWWFHLHSRGERVTRTGWRCVVCVPGLPTLIGNGETPDAAADVALAKYHAAAQGEELDRMAESDA